MLTAAVAVAGVAVGAVATAAVVAWRGRLVWRRQRPRWGAGVGRPAVRAVAAATAQLGRVAPDEPWRVGGGRP